MNRNSHISRMTVARLAAGLGIAGLALAPAASAHVTLTNNQATAGGYTLLTFKVPTESATASTTKLVVDLPKDQPFGSVSYQPMPGWTVKVTNQKLSKPIKTDDGSITEAPTQIEWTADSSAAIKPGQFQTFTVSAGPVPDTGKMYFDAHQTYSDGTVVNWTDRATGSSEPEHPAPILYVNDQAPGGYGHSHGGASSSASPSVTASAASHGSTTDVDNSARWLGAGGLVVGLAGLVTGFLALTRSKKRAA